MKNIITISFLTLLGASCQSAGFGSSDDFAYRSVELSAGTGELDQADQFDDTDDPTTFQVSVLVQDSRGPTTIANRPEGFVGEWGLGYSSGSGSFDEVALPGATFNGVEVSHDHVQLHAGLRYYFDAGPDWVQPYLGASAAGRYYMLDAGGDDTANEFALGFLGRAGVDFPLGDSARFGVAYQMSAGMEPEIDGEDTDLDDHSILLSVGWSF